MAPEHTPPFRPLSSRLYENLQDLQQMQALLMEARAKTNDWRYWHVGELAFSFFMVDCHLDPREHIRLWHNDEGKLVGYAMLGEDPSFDWQVLPDYEWTGIEPEAWDWADTLREELSWKDPKRWGGKFKCGVRLDDTQRIVFLEEHGFQPGEYAEVNMLRALSEPIPEPSVPSGCVVRAVAETGEAPMRALAQREVWGQWTVGNVTDDDYVRFMRLPGYQRDLDVVAVMPDGVIAAYVNGWIDTPNLIGDLGPVGARTAYRRQGLTRAVLLACLRRMKERGMNRACVSTGVTNEAARQLYGSIGFKVANRYLEYVKVE